MKPVKEKEMTVIKIHIPHNHMKISRVTELTHTPPEQK